MVAGSELVEVFTHGDVSLVGGHHETGVGELRDLLGDICATTRGWALPTFVTAIPEPRSISELPSTSMITPPPARSANTGRVPPTPAETAAVRRAIKHRVGSGNFGDQVARLGQVGADRRSVMAPG